jgi:ferritin-like metal-binding protein YciE
MTTDIKANLLDWLRNAHAMEQQAESMLTALSGRIEHYPDVKMRIDQHIQETKGQQEKLARCIERYGGSPSSVKDTMAKMAAFGQAAATSMASDEIVKGSINSYIFETLEIATYTSLIAAAKVVGDVETQRVCEEILEQEQDMAKWAIAGLPGVVKAFMARDAAPDVEAKH